MAADFSREAQMCTLLPQLQLGSFFFPAAFSSEEPHRRVARRFCPEPGLGDSLSGFRISEELVDECLCVCLFTLYLLKRVCERGVGVGVTEDGREGETR